MKNIIFITEHSDGYFLPNPLIVNVLVLWIKKVTKIIIIIYTNTIKFFSFFSFYKYLFA